AARLAQALDEAGYNRTGGPGAHRLTTRMAPHGIAVEIHTAVPGMAADVLARLRPAASGSPLLVLHPTDHLVYLLHHSVLQHAERRGRMRDLLLVAEALANAAPAEVRAAEEAIAHQRNPGTLAAQLEMARAIAAGNGAPADAFELAAAGRYVMTLSFRRWGLRGAFRNWAVRASAAAVARRSGVPWSLGEDTLELPSRFAPFAALKRLSPRAERASRRLVRRVPEWALFPVGMRVAAAAAAALRERHGA
ncbi:MAG: nucleotidyltransferase family protein, partial [Gemmatimonadetes bacterium]|nr:nucleotidyltransferase family protein [Gemmatimonadota bacterium]